MRSGIGSKSNRPSLFALSAKRSGSTCKGVEEASSCAAGSSRKRSLTCAMTESFKGVSCGSAFLGRVPSARFLRRLFFRTTFTVETGISNISAYSISSFIHNLLIALVILLYVAKLTNRTKKRKFCAKKHAKLDTGKRWNYISITYDNTRSTNSDRAFRNGETERRRA